MWPLLCVWSATDWNIVRCHMMVLVPCRIKFWAKEKPACAACDELAECVLSTPKGKAPGFCFLTSSSSNYILTASFWLDTKHTGAKRFACQNKTIKNEAWRRNSVGRRGKSADISSLYEEQIPCVGTSEDGIEFHFARTKSVSSRLPPFLFSFPKPSPPPFLLKRR